MMSGSVWTQDNIVNSPFKDIEIPNETVPEYIWRNLNKWADRTAVVCGVTHRSFSYSQIYTYSRNFAASLRTHFEIKDGDVVGLLILNTLEYPIAVLGAMQAGAAITTISPVYTALEIYRQLILAKPKIVISTIENVKILQEAIRMTKSEITIITVKHYNENVCLETISFEELMNDEEVDKNILNEVKRQPNDVVLLPYSSGTTGLPKGVELTNKNIVANFAQQEIDGLRHYKETTNQYQDSVMAVIPFYHIYGLTVIMLHKLAIGAKLVILPKFQPTIFINALKNYKINLLYVVPPLVLLLGIHPDVKKDISVDRIVCAAAPISKMDIQRLLDKLKPDVKFLQLYGLTEVSPTTTLSMPGSHDYTTVGFAVPNCQLKVVDYEERNLGPDEVGELQIRGPHVMRGYRDNPEATKEAITGDGWLRSGDLASINSDGAVTLVGRIKDVIKVKGYQVPPAELEDILKEHLNVLEAAVVGIPDDKKGEIPRAFVVLKEGHKTTASNLKEFVNKNVAEYKRISEVIFLDALPRNPSGKILRRVLKKYDI